jgi:four helix bundle protein
MGFENLKVYGAAAQLRAEVDRLVQDMEPGARRQGKNMLKHLDEALDSISNNVAEGNDSNYPLKKIAFFDIAAGSCSEVRNAIRSLIKRGLMDSASAAKAISLTYLIAKMIRALIASVPLPG